MKQSIQKYLPFGMEKVIVITSEADLQKSFEEQNIIAAKIVEYDLASKQYTLCLCKDIYGTMKNEFFEKQNTAASMVGTTISVVISSKENGMIMCKIDPRFEDAKKILRNYENGTKLIGKVVNVLQYGVFVDVGLGATSILHINEIKAMYGEEINNPSQIFSIGDIVNVFTNNTNEGTRFSLIKKSDERKSTSLLDFLKNKVAS